MKPRYTFILLGYIFVEEKKKAETSNGMKDLGMRQSERLLDGKRQVWEVRGRVHTQP